MKQFLIKYAPILPGALYGLVLRLIFNIPYGNHFSFTDLFSITFIWIVPFIMGVAPLIFAKKRYLENIGYTAFVPLLSILLFAIICFITRIEDIICIVIIALPFLLCAMFGGLAFGRLILKYRERRGIVYSILFIPLVAGIVEEQFIIPSQAFEIRTVRIINASPDNIWKNVIRVKEIKNNEYSKGFYNYAGIPKPIFAELDKDTIGATRIGHFEGGLLFKETVSYWDKRNKISFNIKVIQSTLRNTVFDQHLLTGKHFEFLTASYELKKITSSQTQLTLTSSYQLDTRINMYASMWGNSMLSDFQGRLLDVIKVRCEKNQTP
ncbi:hypothetical protein NAF17_10730 [Mucilaginibacter sp. RB4R14]|uniref:hypothetical protein n=1 Tax=Mucilaginibacter aurantiaciroseus TaxID=2949308 RepID=UPI00209079DA|nr:hypothetical protein [Mucilaginibacter aurantiaciroseus]MCO5936014.1 hypothetical protein [Mucilaginibacter aurantiaciroseus]